MTVDHFLYRYVEAAVYTGDSRGFISRTFRDNRMFGLSGRRRGRGRPDVEALLRRMGSESHGENWKLKDIDKTKFMPGQKGGGEDEEEDDVDGDGTVFASFQVGKWKAQGFKSLERYSTEDVGRMKDLVVSGGLMGKKTRLQVECLRPVTSVTTTVRKRTGTGTGEYGSCRDNYSAGGRKGCSLFACNTVGGRAGLLLFRRARSRCLRRYPYRRRRRR